MMGDARGQFVLVDLNVLRMLGDVPEELYGERATFPLDSSVVRRLGLRMLTVGPEDPVADPDTPVAGRDDLIAFAVDNRGNISERAAQRNASATWNGLGRAAKRVQVAHEVAALLPFSDRPDLLIAWHDEEMGAGTFEKLTALPLRTVRPTDARDPTEWADPLLDMDSVYESLGVMLEKGYRPASTYFKHLGATSLDLAARFTNHSLPDREPLPTLPPRR